MTQILENSPRRPWTIIAPTIVNTKPIAATDVNHDQMPVMAGRISPIAPSISKMPISLTFQGARSFTHPMAQALRLLGDMWTLMLVYTLLSGPRRFGELMEALGNVSPKTVSQRLKMLEEIGFVQRQAFAEIPPRVEYRLTEKGLALVDIMEAIRQFAERYLAENEAPSPKSVSPTASPSCEY